MRRQSFPHNGYMTTPNKLTLIQIQTQGKGFSYNAWMVKTDDNTVLGFMDKYRNTRTEEHPYKIYGAKLNASGDAFQYDTSVFIPVYGTRTEALKVMTEKCKAVRLA